MKNLEFGIVSENREEIEVDDQDGLAPMICLFSVGMSFHNAWRKVSHLYFAYDFFIPYR